MPRDPLDIDGRIDDKLNAHRSRSPIDHTPRGVMPPVYSDATRPSAASVGAGYVIYNSSDNGLNVSDGTNWRMPGSATAWVTT